MGSRDDASAWGGCKPWFHNLRRRLLPESAVANIPAETWDARCLWSLLHLVHEWRTPLSLVDGPLQRLAAISGLGPEAEECVRIARQNCLRLIHLSDGLPERIRRGHRRPPQIEEVALDAWLRDMASVVAHHPGLDAARLVDAFGADGVRVRADVRGLECIFLNLFSNAVKFSAGRGQIRIGSCVRGRNAGFFVEDQGIGIAPEHHEAVFQPFRRLVVPPSCRQDGLGIGLALVREWTQEMAGRLELRSAPGEGACFMVWLPIAARSSGASAASAPVLCTDTANWVACEPPAGGNVPAPAEIGAQRPTVLLIEDDSELRWLITQALSERFDVRTASNGIEGLTQARDQTPDVLLTDWMMPGISGLEVVRTLRREGLVCKTVLITARMEESERVAALQSGIDDFLAKPFSFAELSARLGNLGRAAMAERALRTLNSRLEVANRELASVRAALIQHEKLKSMGMFAAGMLHEIQNPVSYMQAALTLLREAPQEPPERVAELVGTICDGLDRIGHIVAGLRVFAFRHRDDVPVDTSPGAGPSAALAAADRQLFDVTAPIDAALRFCRHELASLRVEVHAQSCRVVGTEREITQVLINLLSNAAAATRAGEDGHPSGAAVEGAWVRIETRIEDERVVIAVRDNGSGIAPTAMARMFEPFFTTKEIGSGLGLGLAICNAIVRAHGGTLRAQNESPQGARFEFDLRRGDADP